MLRSLRKALTSAAIAVSLTAAAGAGACLASLLIFPPPAPGFQELEVHPWWFVYRDAPAGAAAALSPLRTVAACAVSALLAGLAGARAHVRAERGSSSVALFFAAAFFALSLEGLRGPAALLFFRGHFISAGVVLTRIVYSSRFAGELALLAAGLRAMQMTYRRDVVIIGAVLLVSLAIGLYVPIDRTAFLSSLLFKLGDEQGVWFADLALGILVTVSLVGAAITGRSGWAAALAAASVLLFAGRQIISFSGAASGQAAGLVLLAAGMITALAALRRQAARRREQETARNTRDS